MFLNNCRCVITTSGNTADVIQGKKENQDYLKKVQYALEDITSQRIIILNKFTHWFVLHKILYFLNSGSEFLWVGLSVCLSVHRKNCDISFKLQYLLNYNIDY